LFDSRRADTRRVMEDLLDSPLFQHAVIGLIVATTLLLQAIRLKIERERTTRPRRHKKVRVVMGNHSDHQNPP
jgi:hypothetical protein